MVEALAEFGVFDHHPRADQAGDVESFGGGTEGYGHLAGVVAHRHGGDVASAFEHEVAVDFVADYHHVGLAGHGGHLAQGVFVPLDADGIVGVAQNHHGGVVAFDDLGQAVEVHAVGGAIEQQGILAHHAAVAFDYHAEGVVNGGLDHDVVAAVGEVVDRQAQAFDHAGNEAQLLAGDFEAVAVALPVDDGVPVGIGCGAVAQHGMVEAVAQRGGDFGADGKVEVGYPQGCNIVTAKHLVEAV